MPQPFSITPPRPPSAVSHLGTLDLWHKWAPPAAPEKHWKTGRSAMELAKAWRGGAVPEEFRIAFVGTPFHRFDPTHGLAETTTKFDNRRGPRHHDLLVYGTIDGERALVDVEAKADEKFGNTTLGAVIAKGSPGEQARALELAKHLFGVEAVPPSGPLARLRYQLVFGFYASVIRASTQGSDRATRGLFVAQVFINETCRASAIRDCRRDLQAFVRELDVEGRNPTRDSPVVGPLKPRPASTWADLGVEMWVGRIETWQAHPRK